jgi:hypothetical protein
MLSSGRAGAAKITVIGQHVLTSEQLADAAGRIRTVADLALAEPGTTTASARLAV